MLERMTRRLGVMVSWLGHELYCIGGSLELAADEMYWRKQDHTQS